MTETQKKMIAKYEATGRIVSVRKKRDGKIEVSLNGGRGLPVKEAIAKINEFFA